MKILVLYRAIHNTAGGVERMSNLIMNEMTERGHQIEFVTFDRNDAISFYPLNPSIKWHKLESGDTLQNANFTTRLERILGIRKFIKLFKPDVLLAFQEASFLSARLAVIGLDTPIIAAERNSPSRFRFMDVSKRQLAFLSFHFARFITIQSASFASYYPKRLQSKIRVIPNPVFPIASFSKVKKEKIILSVGRLEYQKNFQVLIKAFAKIAPVFPDWKLVIPGEGQDRAELEMLVTGLNLKDRVLLPGHTTDLSSYYQKASVFCLPSRWEGFPNALAEAFSYGLPSIGFQDCDGVRDLIKNGRNGFLAEGNANIPSLAKTLIKLLNNEKLRDEMSLEAIRSVQAYQPSSIFDQWEELLKEASGL